MGKTPTYTDHAIERMIMRGVSQAEAELTFRRPDRSAPGDNGATNYYEDIDGRTIRVTVGSDLFDPKALVFVTVAVKEKI